MRNTITGSSLLETGNPECMFNGMGNISHEKETEGKMERIINGTSFQRYRTIDNMKRCIQCWIFLKGAEVIVLRQRKRSQYDGYPGKC